MQSNSNQKPNKLIHEKSPYLLQHAYNPVHWFPWGEEAFAKAKREDKVILLSIGYSTCHWCHVMERESFEDENTATILNQYFVSIKLDREERPDIDKIYMDALHAMGQQGGWPLNLFLTPEKEPILGGTYFPPEARYGRKGFKEVLQLVANAWQNQKSELEQAAKDLADHLRDSERKNAGESLPSTDVFERTYQMFSRVYDPIFFGFKMNQQNKFPPSMSLSYLIDYSYFFENPHALEIAYNTAYAMKKGGIYDQVGGGLCRYATDHEWLVPHFEKMLYDNSLFLTALAKLYQTTQDPFFRFAIQDIIGYYRRDMTLPDGGIASAEDADSEGEEGKFYIWSLEEFDEIVSDPWVKELWNVTEEGNFEGHTILNEIISGTNPFQTKMEISESKGKSLQEAKGKLLSRRSERIRPLRDDKIITSWNCLYIRSLILSSQATGDNTYLEDAVRIYSFIDKNLRDKDGFLYRRFREGEARFQGNLTDYAEFTYSSLLLFQETANIQYFRNAKSTLKIIEAYFASEAGVYYESISTNTDLIVKTVEGYDGVEPSGNSTMAHVFLLLSGFGVDAGFHWDKAKNIFSYFKKELSENSTSYSFMLDAYLKWSKGPTEVAVIYKKENGSEAEEIKKALSSYLNPNVVWVVMEEEDAKKYANEIPLLEYRTGGDSHQVYVCKNLVCETPVKGWEATKLLIGK
ncbi:thioredoxin domain-containing protein [Leptospira ilyithenensis]|uniref:thioredoxin domain-containing protein n=1 Tax=Leptospira ilyithenensis TaxID=2484901 RepID=UPI0014385C07|nr:thioredoxin domain-containing protein [Leptospira ilyithenensis]